MDEGDIFAREKLLIGDEKFSEVSKKCVLVAGIGGVGGACVQSLARAGIHNFILIDGDEVEPTNINRQVIANKNTLGMKKVDAAKDMILSINSNAKVQAVDAIISKENIDELLPWEIIKNIDYIVDAIDDIGAKVELALLAKRYEKHIVSSMATGKRLDPGKLTLGDVYGVQGAFARKLKKAYREAGVESEEVIYSTESQIADSHENEEHKISSIAFVPIAAGNLMAATIFKKMLKM